MRFAAPRLLVAVTFPCSSSTVSAITMAIAITALIVPVVIPPSVATAVSLTTFSAITATATSLLCILTVTRPFAFAFRSILSILRSLCSRGPVLFVSAAATITVAATAVPIPIPISAAATSPTIPITVSVAAAPCGVVCLSTFLTLTDALADVYKPLTDLHKSSMNLAILMPELCLGRIPALHAGAAHLANILCASCACLLLPIPRSLLNAFGKFQFHLRLVELVILCKGFSFEEKCRSLVIQFFYLCLGGLVRTSLLNLLVGGLDVAPLACHSFISPTRKLLQVVLQLPLVLPQVFFPVRVLFKFGLHCL
mmetsp:Transcript_86233/g.171211  ORF Transcript_86233/g.171211 Transcript_86233/m.171211 type:complete len:311 (-) Transcript_86233:341-1273(-)